MDVAITHSPFITALHLFDTIEHLQPKGQRKEWNAVAACVQTNALKVIRVFHLVMASDLELHT